MRWLSKLFVFSYLIYTAIPFITATPNAWAETLTFECNYPVFSDKDGSHKVKGSFDLTFVVDTENGAAYVLGSQGSEKVHFLSTEGGVSFIEITGSNNLMTTTIDKSGDTVHSRNTIINGAIVPSQYYGNCVIK
jgi:hypothetical protein